MHNNFSDLVKVSPQFQRSIKIDADITNAQALDGYICQTTAINVLETMANHIKYSNQRAFTWTGPYGGGKSSLALLLCSLMSSAKSLQKTAREKLNVPRKHIINEVFSTNDNWCVLPIVGKRDSVITSIASTISSNFPRRKKPIHTGDDVISSLTKLAESKNNTGVLLVIDELGKFLESASKTGDDIYFYQQLAEAANRCNGKLIIVGILHQAFEQYASRLGSETRNEWAKVQGRFIDIPVVSATDEVMHLISKAIIHTKPYDYSKTSYWARVVSSSIEKRRPGTPSTIVNALYECWPLHPVTTPLIGQVSKRKFSQSERSTFGFLSSAEPMSFSEFILGHEVNPTTVYTPAMYWDYLRANYDLSIIASPDGHKWSVAIDAIERAESKGLSLHVKLAKTIALIDLFSNGSGLLAETNVLKICVPPYSGTKIEDALKDLSDWSVIVYRRHLNAWAIFAGSDFDLDSAITNAKEDIQALDNNLLENLNCLNPIVAKRHYQKTGSIRWLNRTISTFDDIDTHISRLKNEPGCCGNFILLLLNNNQSTRSAITLAKKASNLSTPFPAVVGIPENSDLIINLCLDLSALKQIMNQSTVIEGDSVARNEISTRLAAITVELDEEVRNAFNHARWFIFGEEIKSNNHNNLTRLASEIADNLFDLSPSIYSELLNREILNSTIAKARRTLMYRMLSHQTEENLGFHGYPVEAGLYFTTLKSTGIHQNINGSWGFYNPPYTKIHQRGSVAHAWNALDKIIKSAKNSNIALVDIYELLNKPPYGVKNGFLPLFIFSYFLANRSCLAIYIENIFIPEIGEVQIDEILQDPKRISIRYVEIMKQKKVLLENLSQALSKHLKTEISADPLDSARALVSLIYNLPNWTKYTDTISQKSKDIRHMLLKASDPHKVIFNDLPGIFKLNGQELANQVAESIHELNNAYQNTLKQVENKLLIALDHTDSLKKLRLRAEKIAGRSGDFRLDAFIGRLGSYEGTHEDIEGLLSLSINKPPTEWTDRDINAALIQLSEWSLNFRKVEALTLFEDNTNFRRSIAVIFSGGGGYTFSDILDFDSEDQRISKIATDILNRQKNTGVDTKLFLAALAEAGAQLLEATK